MFYQRALSKVLLFSIAAEQGWAEEKIKNKHTNKTNEEIANTDTEKVKLDHWP